MPAIRITQLTDANGNSSPQHFLRELEPSVVLPPASSAITVMMSLGARPTAEAARYDYVHEGYGAGFLELEGFAPDELQAIGDYFRVEEVSRGLDVPNPGQWVQTRPYPQLPQPTRNPITMVILASVALMVCIVGIIVTLNPPAGSASEGAWYIPAAIAVLAILAIVVIVQHARRIAWWRAARAATIANGGVIPRGLRSFD